MLDAIHRLVVAEGMLHESTFDAPGRDAGRLLRGLESDGCGGDRCGTRRRDCVKRQCGDHPQLMCSTESGSFVYRLFGSADYTDDNAAGRRQWTVFRYMVRGGTMSDDHNNVNIRVSKLGDVAFDYESPDELEFNRWYTVVPPEPVYTSLRGPNGERDHRTNHLVEMTGIFDYPGLSDPSCYASVKV
jgi:hypothetical protein